MKRNYLFAAMLLSMSAQAQEQNEELEEVIVKTNPLAEGGTSQSIEILAGDDLTNAAAATLGETVAFLPGIRNGFFGPAAGRPVIHGLAGPRVKATQDRIDTLDVSVTSADHAVTVEPFIANSVTILKGPSVLLYGSGAIGGVVDTDTGRIPTKLPEDGIEGRAEARFTDNSDGVVGAFRLDGKAGESVAWHIDVFGKDADPYDIPGEIFSDQFIAASGEEPEEGDGTLPASFFDAQGGAIGVSWIGENGFIGASISTTESVYGLVGLGEEEEGEEGEEGEEFDGGEEEEEGSAFIDLEQTRIDIEAELRLDEAFFHTINFRLGANDYEHVEFEAPGEPGTSFDNEAYEARLLLSHQPVFGFTGTYGIQVGDRDFSAIGAEAFVPPVDTQNAGFFWVGERQIGKLTIEGGSRIERVEHEAETFPGQEFSFTNSSLSGGLLYQASEQSLFAAQLDLTERAPSPEELFSNGPHIATQSFDIGDPNLDEETSFSLNLSWAYTAENFNVNISLYRIDFDGFIFQGNTGEIEDGFPVLAYFQEDADYTGIDVGADIQLGEFAGGGLDLLLGFDTLEVDLDDGGNLPRIPSDRFTVGLDWQNDVYQAKATFTSQSSQDEVAAFELPTDSYTDLSFLISRKWQVNDSEFSLFLHGKNLGDEEQREHVSFVKDFAPLAGRRFEVGVQFNF